MVRTSIDAVSLVGGHLRPLAAGQVRIPIVSDLQGQAGQFDEACGYLIGAGLSKGEVLKDGGLVAPHSDGVTVLRQAPHSDGVTVLRQGRHSDGVTVLRELRIVAEQYLKFVAWVVQRVAHRDCELRVVAHELLREISFFEAHGKILVAQNAAATGRVVMF